MTAGFRSRITLTSAAVSAALGRLQQRGTDLYPAMLQVAGILMDNLDESFETGTTANMQRAPFAPLSPRYKKRRFALGFTGPILTRKGVMRTSFETRASQREAVIGTALRYAGFHQFGAGKLPARPVLGLDTERRGEVLRVLNAYLAEALTP